MPRLFRTVRALALVLAALGIGCDLGSVVAPDAAVGDGLAPTDLALGCGPGQPCATGVCCLRTNDTWSLPAYPGRCVPSAADCPFFDRYEENDIQTLACTVDADCWNDPQFLCCAALSVLDAGAPYRICTQNLSRTTDAGWRACR